MSPRYTFSLIYLSTYCLILSLSFLLNSCGDGFTETKSNGIYFEPQQVTFSSPGRNETFKNEIIQLGQSGETSLTISNIYIKGLESCDRITAGVPPSQVLTPEVLSECSIMISERPELPITLNNNEFKQIIVTFRPIVGVDTPESILVIESDALDNEEVEIPMAFENSSPQIAGLKLMVFPSTGTSSDFYTIRNDGTAPLLITNVYIEADPEYPPFVNEQGESSIEFSWDTRSGAPLPITLSPAAGTQTDLTVTHEPLDIGPNQAYMIIQSTSQVGFPLPDLRVLLTSKEEPKFLEVTPNPVVFEHMVGQKNQQLINFNNKGLEPVSVFDIEFEPADGPFRVGSASQDSFQIFGGGSQEVIVEYQAPTDPQVSTMLVRTDAENGEDGYLSVPLITQGNNGFKNLNVDLSVVNFDGVATGESKEITVVLTSTGTDPVTISEITLEGSEVDLTTFKLISGTETSTLDASQTQSITLSFTRPADEMVASVYTASLQIKSDSLGGNIEVILLANP